MIGLMTEWRYEVWRELHERGRVESFLLMDTGTVGRKFSRMSLSDLRWSFGFGARLVWGAEVRWLGALAFGKDGARFDVKYSHVF